MEKYLYICVGGTFLGYQDEIMIMDNQSKIASKWIGTAYGDTSPSIKYIYPDNLGSSNTICDDSGSFYNREEYYPFGETSFGSYGKKRYRFSGKEKDDESGLYYYGARYYLSWTCRFVSIDPLAEKFSWSGFCYAKNNPINWIDNHGANPTKPKITGKEKEGDHQKTSETVTVSTWRKYYGDMFEWKTSKTVETDWFWHGARKGDQKPSGWYTKSEYDQISKPKSTSKSSQGSSNENKGKQKKKGSNENWSGSGKIDTKNATGSDAADKRITEARNLQDKMLKVDQTWTTEKDVKKHGKPVIGPDGKVVKKTITHHGTKYLQDHSDMNSLKTSDCTKFVQLALEAAGQGGLLGGRLNGSCQMQIAAIKKYDGNNAFRTDNPKKGDLMYWGGHVAIVTAFDGTNISFINMGHSGPVEYTNVSFKQVINETVKNRIYGAGGFVGFWTPH